MSVCVCVRGWVGWGEVVVVGGVGLEGGGGHASDACRLDNICALRPKRP